jgi:hypothetical protein
MGENFEKLALPGEEIEYQTFISKGQTEGNKSQKSKKKDKKKKKNKKKKPNYWKFYIVAFIVAAIAILYNFPKIPSKSEEFSLITERGTDTRSIRFEPDKSAKDIFEILKRFNNRYPIICMHHINMGKVNKQLCSLYLEYFDEYILLVNPEYIPLGNNVDIVENSISTIGPVTKSRSDKIKILSETYSMTIIVDGDLAFRAQMVIDEMTHFA